MVISGANCVIRSLEMSAISSGLQGRERNWKLSSISSDNDLASHACVMKPPQTQKDNVDETEFRGTVLGVVPSEKAWKLGPFPSLALCVSSIGLCLSYILLFLD